MVLESFFGALSGKGVFGEIGVPLKREACFRGFRPPKIDQTSSKKRACFRTRSGIAFLMDFGPFTESFWEPKTSQNRQKNDLDL